MLCAYAGEMVKKIAANNATTVKFILVSAFIFMIIH